jgi:hypothetical protein
MPSLSNIQDAQAYRGQAVKVTCNPEIVQTLTLGALAVVGDLITPTGYISEIDFYGNSIKITPIQPDKRFDSIPGILQAGQTIVVF